MPPHLSQLPEPPPAVLAIDASRSLGELLDAARAGDVPAWSELVQRTTPMLRGVVRRYGLSPAQVDDVVQTTWLRLLEHSARLRESAAVGKWLAVTARREAFRVLQLRVREHLTADPLVGEDAVTAGPEPELLNAERRVVLTTAIGTLPDRHRGLMDLMLSEPGLEYREVSARTGIPMGSIGPIRGRCLVRMAADPQIRALRD
jgi:RNA polymerase sigma factor (sigma-70 family)